MTPQRRKVDLSSKSDIDGLNSLRVLFFYLPLIVNIVVVGLSFLSNQLNFVVVATLLTLPLSMLALGFLTLDIGYAQAQRGAYDVAEFFYKIAIVLMCLFRLGPLRNFQVLPVSILAELSLIRGKHKEAIELYRRNAQLSRAGQRGKDVHENYLVVMLKDIGICAYSAGKYEDALDSLQRAIILTIREQYSSEDSIGIPEEGDTLDQERLVSLARLILEKIRVNEANFSQSARMIFYLGAVLRQKRNLASADALMTPAMLLFEKHYQPDDPDLFCVLIEYALLLKEMGNTRSAQLYFKKAENIAITRLNSKHPYFEMLNSRERQIS